MSLRNQVILFGAMGMVWYIIIAVLALVDTGTIAVEFFKPPNMPYEKYRWFEPYQLFLFGIAGMITGAALWRLRDMRRSTKTLILQSALVCLAATCSFWLARGPELLLFGGGITHPAALLVIPLCPLFSILVMAPVLYPLALCSIGILWWLYPAHTPTESARERPNYAWIISGYGSLLLVGGSIVLQFSFMLFQPSLPFDHMTEPEIPSSTTRLDLDIGPVPPLTNDERLLQKLTRSHLWHVIPHERATKPEQIIAQRRHEHLYMWNSEAIATLPGLPGGEQMWLEVDFGLGQAPSELRNVNYPSYPVEKIPLTDTINVPVHKKPSHPYISHVAVTGSDFWIRVYEGSSDKSRTTTQRIIRGAFAELAAMVKDAQDAGSTSALRYFILDLDKGQLPHYKRVISGSINMGRPGTLCHVVDGARIEIPLSRCGRDRENAALVSWSRNSYDSFPFRLPVFIPGPGDGEPYHWHHSHEIWFVPLHGEEPILLATGSSRGGVLTFDAQESRP